MTEAGRRARRGFSNVMSEHSPDKDSPGGTAVAEPAKGKPKLKPRAKPARSPQNPKPQPPYAVVVLNDEDHT